MNTIKNSVIATFLPLAAILLMMNTGAFGQSDLKTDVSSTKAQTLIAVREGHASELTVQNPGKLGILTIRNESIDLQASVDIWATDNETGDEIARITIDLAENSEIDLTVEELFPQLGVAESKSYSVHIDAFTDSRPSDGPVSALSLPVAFFSQCDGRWGSNKVGSSGKTICQIGCAMTSVTMASASKYSNSNPGSMNGYLSSNSGYTSGGSLYWAKPPQWQPSAGFRYLGSGTVSNAANLKALIDAGKFVVAWSSRYGNHWVLIYRYNGLGNRLSDFEYLDPGDSSWRLHTVGDSLVTASSNTRIYQ